MTDPKFLANLDSKLQAKGIGPDARDRLLRRAYLDPRSPQIDIERPRPAQLACSIEPIHVLRDSIGMVIVVVVVLGLLVLAMVGGFR